MASLACVVAACVLPVALAAQAQQPNTVVRESTVTATVDRIERSSRVATFKSDQNVYQSLYFPPDVKAFDTLAVGDVVTARYTESVIVAVRPGARLAPQKDTTERARQQDPTVTQQYTTVVTIEGIDGHDAFVTYRTDQNLRAVRAVQNKSLLKGLRVGDRDEITVTLSRVVSVEPRRR